MGYGTLGIIGGMGPLATAYLFNQIIGLTEAKCDQDHIHVLIDNNTEIPDRTDYLLHGGQNPLGKLVESAKLLEASGADFLIMPCNTAHYFYNDIKKEINIPFINMIDETARYILEYHPDIKRVGLLATEGTCRTGVYDHVFRNYGIEIVKPSAEEQSYVSEMIYSVKSGTYGKEIPPGYQEVLGSLLKLTGVTVLGCTELPVAHSIYGLNGSYVNTLQVLAENAVRLAGKKVRVKGIC